MSDFSIIKQMLDSNGKQQVISSDIVVDSSTGKKMPQHITDSVSNAVAALKGGVGVDYDNLKKISDVLDTTKTAVDVFLSDGTDATPETVDTLKELLASITTNKTTIDALLGDKLNKTSIVNDLTIGGADKVLSAEQGKALKALIDALHTFANASTLDGISKNSTSGNIVYNGKELNGETGLAFVANTDEVAVYNGTIRFVVESYTPPVA